MSITVLYCEGNPQSIDIRVIRQLLPRECTIRPLGGKTSSFMQSIISDRNINPNLAGLVDHDFDCRDWESNGHPIPCNYQNIQVGWAWERKEIENYLIDPKIVQKALGRKTPAEYQSVLAKAAKKIATYTAARTALSCSGFKNFWGEEIKDSHFPKSYRFPTKEVDINICHIKLEEIVREFKGNRLVETDNVIEKFEQLLPSFKPGGFRFENFLTYFAGKDILCAMKEDLIYLGFDFDNPIHQFLERIVTRIERAEDVWRWLPEWQNLRDIIHNYNSDFHPF
ncbi:MAG TPA: hypothetical protein DEF27_05710 [Oscillatoriales bacterium UBA8482]|nr:hypothetical protein [Oscillatoriales bacterium UBA8482]